MYDPAVPGEPASALQLVAQLGRAISGTQHTWRATTSQGRDRRQQPKTCPRVIWAWGDE